MVGVGAMFTIHGARARRAGLAMSFAVTAALGALAGTVFAQATSAPAVATLPAGAHMALYVQIQSWDAAASATDRRLYLQTVVVNGSRDTASAPAAQDFSVRAADGRVWSVSPAGPAFPTLSLQPGEQRDLDMLAVLPASASRLRLVLRSAGQVRSIPLVS
jgi:hypothetical protein